MIQGQPRGAEAAQEELKRLGEQGEAIVQRLYPLLASYLDDLRKHLETHLLQAVFQLATQIYPKEFTALSHGERQALRQRLHRLCQRCGSLLTIEQLLQLALRLEHHDPSPRPLEQTSEDEAVAAAEAPPLPPGSIALDLQTPPLLGSFDPWLFSGQPPEEADDASDDDQDEGNLDSNDGQVDEQVEAEEIQRQEFDIRSTEAFALLQDLMGGGGLQSNPSLGPDAFTVAFPMPRHPLGLHRWLQGWDKALTRRLRNLSHAVNVELLRFGLTRSLMPMALLDAVLEGQADAQSAPANLLSLSLPLGPRGLEQDFNMHAVLLRSSDFEYLRPPLRRRRAQIRQLDKNLLRMARRQHHWQQRLAIRQAEQQWLEDNEQPLTPDP